MKPSVHFADLVSIPKPDIPVGGRLRHFRSQWNTVTSDPDILKIISGFQLPLVDFQKQKHAPNPLTFSEMEMRAADEQIEQLLAKGAIMECDSIDENDFVSTVFLRPKKDGGFRMILNLKGFNEYIEYQHFKMETIKDIMHAIVPNCFMAVADLSDAYLVIPIAKWHWRFLKFRWRGKIYCYLVLPFGLACAPRVFTKVAKVPLSLLREKGHIAFMYIDDGFIMGYTFQQCFAAVRCFLDIFTSLGFLPHPRKCMLYPSQQVSVLGFIVNSVSMTISIADDKKNEIYSLCIQAMHEPTMSIRMLCHLIGKLISVMLALPLGQAHYRRLERVKTMALVKSGFNYEATCTLPPFVFPDLIWWSHNIFDAQAPLRREFPSISVFSDASSFGWGSVVLSHKAQGKFLLPELPWSINTKECLAIYYGVRSFLSVLENKHVLIRTDNTTAVAAVQKMGSSSSHIRDMIMRDLWALAVTHNMWFSVAHVRGVCNQAADSQSRLFNDRTEWALPMVIFQKLQQIYPEMDVDLFASYANHKLDKFVAWRHDPQAWAVDAFTFSWRQFVLPYIYAPFSLLMRIFQHIILDQVQTVLLLPTWPSQPWWPLLLNHLVDLPILLPQEVNVFLPWAPEKRHPLQHRLNLFFAKVSGRQQDVTMFQTQLRNTYKNDINYPPGSPMVDFSRFGRNFVVNGESIPVRFL